MSSKFKLGDSVTITRGDHMYCGLQGKVTEGKNHNDYYQVKEDGATTHCPIYVKESDLTFTSEVAQFSAPVTKSMTALDKQEGGGHYKNMAIQPVEYITANNMPYLEGNVIKYVSRHTNKNGEEDIKKAIHYLEMILQLCYDPDRECPF